MTNLKDLLALQANVPSDYTAAETALMSSELFRRGRLCLFRLVSRFDGQDLLPKYLVVRDDVPLLELHVSPNDSDYHSDRRLSPSSLPVFCVKKYQMKRGQIQNVLFPMQKAIARAMQDTSCIRRLVSIEPVPTELHSAMARLHMIQKQPGYTWVPTEYGLSLGLLDGYLPAAGGRPLHTIFLASKRFPELYAALNWTRDNRRPVQVVMSLEQRMERIRQGLPCNNASAAAPVQAFGAMPLKDYMASVPEGADSLLEKFGETGTFQEAADRIFQSWRGSDGRMSALIKLDQAMDSLLVPIFYIMAGKALDVPIVPFIQKFISQPFPSLLMGAAISAGQPCLLHNTEILQSHYKYKPKTSLETLLYESVHDTFCSRFESWFLLYILFVEPFALMNQSAVLWTKNSQTATEPTTDEIRKDA